MAYLLDTNILSELRRGRKCDPNVRAWARSTASEQHYISVLSLGEIRKGIESLRRKSKAQSGILEHWLETLNAVYSREIIPVNEDIADRWGRLMARRTLPVIDGLIAATALEFDLTVATRNVEDFKSSGVSVINPFEEI